MKKTLFAFTLFFAILLLASCQKEYGYYSSCRLKVVLDLSTAVRNFEDEDEELFSLDKDHAIRVKFFLYDASGNLYADRTEYEDSYYDSYEVYRFEDIPLGDYTLITATDVVERTGTNKYSYAHLYWEFEGVDRLATFTVLGQDRMDLMGERLLTLNEAKVTINGRRTSQRVSIDAEPVTAMIKTTFWDIFYWDKNVVNGERANRIYNYFDLSFKHDYNVVTYNPSRHEMPWQFAESTTEFDYYLIDRIYPDNIDSKNTSNIYGFHAVLPGSYNFTGYGEYKFSGNETVYSHQTRTSGTARVEAGCLYYVDFDIADWEVNFEGTSYSRAERLTPENGSTIRRDEIHGSDILPRSLQRDSN